MEFSRHIHYLEMLGQAAGEAQIQFTPVLIKGLFCNQEQAPPSSSKRFKLS